MYLIIKSIIIAIVEGITEFLPISSTGHMIVVGDIINFNGEFANLFMIVIQLGAILAVVYKYWDRISESLKNMSPREWGFKFWITIFIAFLPFSMLGSIFGEAIELYLFNTIDVAMALVTGGVLLIIIENKCKDTYAIKDIKDVNFSQAMKIGIFQCLALVPGMSRSASTIMGAMIIGLSPVAAAEFSFFLAIPTMLTASVNSIVKTKLILTNVEVISLVLGFLIAFITALFVINKFISYLQKKPLKIFGVYRIIFGIFSLVLAFANAS